MKNKKNKINKKHVFAIMLTLLGILFVVLLTREKATPILMYHSVSYDQSSTLNVTPENFKAQMAFLKTNGYDVISMDEFIQHMEQGTRFLPKKIVITFDDGFEDNFTNAFPVLTKYNFPAIIYLITNYIGLKDEYLDWDQIIHMMKNGIDFGSHTRNNQYLGSMDDTVVLSNEINGPREDILKNTGVVPKHFCYPLGGFNEKAKNIVKKSGYISACTTNRGNWRDNRDNFELNRIKVTNSDTNKLFHFRAKLSGLYNSFRKIGNSKRAARL